jgi:hypothetical protein
MNGAEILAEDQLTGSAASEDYAILQMGRTPDERRYPRIERSARRATAPAGLS